MKQRIAAFLMCVICLLSVVGCGQTKADTNTPSAANQQTVTDDYLTTISGTYVELFPELSKADYRSIWHDATAPLVGEDNADDATDKLRERADELEAVNAQLREAYARELEHRTMLRNALSEAEAANVAKNTFLSNMSHDIRTPLNAVVGYASLISAHGGEAERVRAYSDKGLAEQLLDVVNETLEISRMEAGHVQLAEAECSLSELVMQVRMDMVDLADRADVTLVCDVEPLTHDRVLVDAVRLSHVLTQLVDNAIKYSPAGSIVHISVAEPARPRASPASALSWPIGA